VHRVVVVYSYPFAVQRNRCRLRVLAESLLRVVPCRAAAVLEALCFIEASQTKPPKLLRPVVIGVHHLGDLGRCQVAVASAMDAVLFVAGFPSAVQIKQILTCPTLQNRSYRIAQVSLESSNKMLDLEDPIRSCPPCIVSGHSELAS
jgi:hypothetical protein